MIKKFITAAVAAAVIGTAAIAVPTEAQAGPGVGAGIAAGIIGGAIIGSAIASHDGYYGPGYYGPGYYGPGYWGHGCHRVWFRDGWGYGHHRVVCR